MKRKKGTLLRKEQMAGLFFVAPQIIYFIFFFALPLFMCIYASFTNWNILSGSRKWVGFRNFEKLFQDEKFWIALKNTIFMLIPIPIYLLLALGFAYCCHKKIMGERIFRVIYYLPFISSIVSLTLVWKWLFNPVYGPVNTVLSCMGFAKPDWLGDPFWTRWMIVIMISWKMIGIISVYYIAALKNIPRSFYETASIDGASAWQQFAKITLPLITPTTFYLLVMGIIGSLQTFLEVQLFAPDGGRNYGVGTIVHYIWQKAFQNSQMGYACACAGIFGMFVMLITLAQFMVSQKWVYAGE